ncbi:MAG: BatD family protein [Roseivirga sp.]|uniref:BatD family protein n=1 Tax=Roseivirga sp. TaxID=1964215 RepID=UPI001B1E0AC6|nr:BatD family protein [Roseivirga sp.]MBO6660863.1 BatD family protein [Roseivirga sp.]MBO6761003.1 BatD family protein [Roseivirga sp.]MBO6909153.1 BatD family protein [Roseivirga sp.]
MRNFGVFLSVLASIFCLSKAAFAQEISVQLGPNEVGMNEFFTITVTVNNAAIKNYTDFPNIDGFAKRGTSSSSKTNIVNGEISSSQSITQRYMPLEEGTYTLEPFSLEVNGTEVSSQGKTIKVTPPVERRQNNRRRYDPFDDLFGRNRNNTESEFMDVKEDAFLALTTDKDEVYVGEGFTTTFAFYVADANRAPLQFHEAGKQLSTILKDLRPENCWEENFSIENIYGERVELNGKNYTRYKIYQATYYPLNLEPVVFPSVPFEMIKYRVAKSPSFFGRDRQEDFKTFNTREKTVKVKALPPHPLKDKVAVGQFELDEKISTNSVETGESFSYEFNIYGEGNISGIPDPSIPDTKEMDIYPPNVAQDINRGAGRVTGSKRYSYFGIPNEPGEYDLKDYFSWIFFNPETENYDTLKSEVKLMVIGESKENVSISSTDLGSFYDNIDIASNELQSLDKSNATQIIANLLIAALLGAAAFMFIRK